MSKYSEQSDFDKSMIKNIALLSTALCIAIAMIL